METFVGDTVKIVLKTGISLVGYTTLSIDFRRPDGSANSWIAAISTNTTWLEYTTSITDLDQEGVWAVQAHVEGAGVKLHGKWAEFTVYNPLDIYPS